MTETAGTKSEVEVSVVLPCLNEEQTLAHCIREARKALDSAGINGEVVVSDNGSEDRSCEIAEEEGARLVHAPARGYGNALYYGFEGARGKYLVHMDADMSYEFSHIPRFVEELRKGADLVMGSRFSGTIDEGSMPFLHRHLGTPVLTAVANLFFGCGISDINCGMRGLTRYAFRRLGLRAGGMEFASEMVIKAAKLDMKIVEIPTNLHKDARDRTPHLRSFRDGWRHLRFMLLFCPTWLFTVPGISMTVGGLILIFAIVADAIPAAGLVTSLAALAATVIGVQATLLGVATHGFVQLRRLSMRRSATEEFASFLTLEKGAIAGGTLGLSGALLLIAAAWRVARFISGDAYTPGEIDLASTKLALLGTAMFITGTQIVISSFFLGLFNIEPLSPPRNPKPVLRVAA